MYLSKVSVDWKMSRNPYNLHQALWSLFPNRPEESRPFLFYVEANQPGKPASLLMLSRYQPIVMSESAQVLSGPKDISSLNLKYDSGYRFLLTANPSKVICDRDNPSRKLRVPLIREDEQLAWLSRKLEGAATIETALPRMNPPIYFRKPGNGSGKVVTATFQGILRVVNPQALLGRIKDGIGPAKSFGCGLLLLSQV